MPRKSRIDAPGSLHHVIMRGIERSSLFRSNADYKDFLARLSGLLEETKTACYAWALMRNHVHLLLRTGPTPLSSFMRRLLTGYAQRFNRRHNRSGHLFQNRYKSFLCEEEPYCLELVRYIHLNPIRAGAVDTLPALGVYPWCGHGVILGKTERPWQDSAFVLHLFHQKESTARKAYALFVEKGIDQGKRADLTGGGLIRSAGGWTAVSTLKRERFASDERILGGSDFVASVLKQAQEDHGQRSRQEITLDKLLTVVCDYFSCEPALLTSPGKQSHISRARAVLSHIAFAVLRFKGTDIARALNLTPPAVSRLSARGRTDESVGEIEKLLRINR
ncbi:MAG: transposase [Syntrophorhabdaceae bacterium]|nr:transposase [Syntrophorhabdaceae bacterium]